MISKSNARMELAIARDRIKELEGQIEIIGKANRDIVKELELANSNLGPALAGYNKLREALEEIRRFYVSSKPPNQIALESIEIAREALKGG